MIGQIRREGGSEGGREGRRRKWKRERMQRRRKKKSGTEAHGLEKLQVLRGLIDVEDGSIVVDLPILGTQHVFILTELCFYFWSIFGLENYCNSMPSSSGRKSRAITLCIKTWMYLIQY